MVTLEDDPEATVVWRYIADDEASGKVEAVPVQVRTASDDGIFIAGDLAAGDRLVGAGAHLMRQGLRVTAWTQEEGL